MVYGGKIKITNYNYSEEIMGKFDYLFNEKNVFSAELYCKGIYPAAKNDSDTFVKKESGEDCDKYSLVLPLNHGSIYRVIFPKNPTALRVAACLSDPRNLKDGEVLSSFRRQA